VAPAGTPRPIINKLNALLMAFIERPDPALSQGMGATR
jgi:hypothetical protein